MPSRTLFQISKKGIPTIYCFVVFQKGLGSVFDEGSQAALVFATIPTIIVIFQPIHTKPWQNIYQNFPDESLSIGENRMKIRAVIFELIANRQTDRQTRRRTLFYDMYRRYIYIHHWRCFDVPFLIKIWFINCFMCKNDREKRTGRKILTSSVYFENLAVLNTRFQTQAVLTLEHHDLLLVSS